MSMKKLIIYYSQGQKSYLVEKDLLEHLCKERIGGLLIKIKVYNEKEGHTSILFINMQNVVMLEVEGDCLYDSDMHIEM